MVKNKDRWSALSLKDRADFMKIAVENGYTNRKEIVNLYETGGNTKDGNNKGYTTTSQEDLQDVETFNSNWYNYRDKQLATIINSNNRGLYTAGLKWYEKLFPTDKTDAIGARNYINARLDNVKEFTMSEALKDINTRKWLQDYYYQHFPNEKPSPELIGPPKPVSDYDLEFLEFLYKGLANNKLNTIVYNEDDFNNSTKIHERAHISIPFIRGWSRHPVLSPISNVQLQNTTEPDSYYDSITEIYARLMQLRYDNNLDPSHTYTQEELEAMKNDPNFKDHHIFNRYTDESILMLLNEIAQNTTDPNRLDYLNPDNIAANGGNINKFAPGGPLNEGIEEYNNTGHENNPLLYEQSYYDDTEIFPTLDLRDFNRRDVKNLAFTVAGRNNDHYGVTVDEVLNDKLNYNSKHSRQEERFKRLVGRQYKRNVRYTEQMERLKAAAQGDISAMQDYITKGTERVAPLGIPFVAGPAAIATAKAGSFALAADAIGKVLSKNAVRWPLEILGFGDFIYNNVFTDEGVKKTIKRAQEGEFWGTIGSGTVDLLDFVGVAGAGYDAMKLLDPNFKNLKRGYKYLTAQKRRLKALDLRNKTLNQSNELYDEIRDFKTDKIQNGGLKFPSLEASYTTEHVSIPAGQASTTTVPFTLPDGSIINLETKVGSKGDVEKWYPVMEDPQWMMYRRVASMNPYSLDFRYNGPSGKTMHTGMSDVPLQAGRNPLFSQYLSDAQRTMGESGVIGGSSVLYDKGYISGVPHDLEIITTKSRKDALIQRIGFDEASATTQPLALNSTSKVAGGKGGTKETDIQIIDEDAQGFAIGKLAHEIYRVMHPEEHAKYLSTKTIENFANPSATSAQMKLPKPGGGYYTANELLDEFNKSGAAVKKTLIDALSVGKLGNSYVGTKLMRPVGILSNTDSALQADILDAIHAIGKFNLGEDFKTVKQLYPNIDYSDVKRNEEFLDALGFDKSLATNPKAMENITEYYHLQLSGSQRVYTNPRSKSDVIKFAHTTKDWGGGHAAGGGGNSTIGTGAAFEYPYRSMSQYPLVKDGAKVKTPLDIMDAYDMRKSDVLLSDIADQDQIQKLKDMGLNITDSTRLGEIDHYLANTNDEAITEEVGNILNINGLFGGDYHAGNTEYFGRYSKNSVADSYRIVDRGNGPQIEYEMGRLLHKYKDMQNNYGVEPQEAIDFKDTIMKTLDDFISGKITDKEGFRFDKGDYDKIVELKKQLEAMESNMSSLQKRTDKLDKIMSDLWDIGDKVDDILSKSVLWGGVAGLGSLLGGVVHSQVKNQKEWDLINEYADDYDKTEEYKDSYYKKLEDAFRTKELDRFSFPYKQYREAYKEHHQNMLNYAKKKKANKYLTGGGLK